MVSCIILIPMNCFAPDLKIGLIKLQTLETLFPLGLLKTGKAFIFVVENTRQTCCQENIESRLTAALYNTQTKNTVRGIIIF